MYIYVSKEDGGQIKQEENTLGSGRVKSWVMIWTCFSLWHRI